ncbi:PP2C family protein-serine/threonine phosphatase [Granulicella sibirica]|uniref:Serine phosphatase RsbU, regulator of sigma subunit n=1 Tax=Granulicella sibirica TaxID=2479048 RepID=A0A4Q0T4W4_9BACT|nr:PP2C family protein-serine/threonine phosphatase [Granulicella sibirica]RXH57049.1 Serine phosphatase RsbU, regulator of sigma subunit [Granulicella sibirica]
MYALARPTLKHLSALFLSFLCLTSLAQSPAPLQRVQSSDGIDHITLGQSVFSLNGPYKFNIGDSPLDPATHQPLWAESGFDDSHWETVDLTPPEGSFDAFSGVTGYVPGWTAQGHPGYSGYAWYRIRVKVANPSGSKLAIAGPDGDVDDGFQVFANGALLGSFGDFSTSHPTVYVAQPTFFPIPHSGLAATADGTEVIAFRFWMEAATLKYVPDAGGFHTAPALGEEGGVGTIYRVRWLEQVRSQAVGIVETLFFFLLVVLAISLSIFDRSDKIYYWITAVYAISACTLVVQIVSYLSQSISEVTSDLLVDVLFVPLCLGLWMMVWRVWFQLKRPVWLPKVALLLTLLYMVGQLLGGEIFSGLVPHTAAVKLHVVSVAVRLAFLALLVLVVVLGVRQQGREGWVALPAVLMLGVSNFQNELMVLHIRVIWFPFGTTVTLDTAASLLLVLALFFLLLRRLFFSLRLQREQALDIKQAAEVQQVILPQSRTVYPGLLIETEYRAARQVGGDFFQIIPHSGDGSTLIVAGDVTGKGLQAGMTVALLVGAIRSTAELNSDPLAMIQALNRRLLGRESSQATCLALSIAANGSCTLANAGHLPPYRNGMPLDMEGALPLGMIDGAEFSVMHFTLADDDKLVMVSDGILEATNEKGELFGFERVAELLRNSTPVKALADAAQLFGQNDDISVVAVTRTA